MIVSENNNRKNAVPAPAQPPPPPPEDVDDLDSQPDFSFNLELSRNQHEQYDTQFAMASTSAPPVVCPPAVTIVGKSKELWTRSALKILKNTLTEYFWTYRELKVKCSIDLF